jgi:hypothetical protein
MDSKLEKQLRNNAIFSPDIDSVKIAPIEKLFKDKLDYLAKGVQARVYKLKNEPWVVKEGKWDYHIDFFNIESTQIPLPAKLISPFMDFFSFTFYPTLKETLRQYKLYLNFIQYFGYFTKDSDYYHPNLEIIKNSQRQIRDSLAYYIPELENFYKIKLNSKLQAILKSKVSKHNFLPKEYLLYGTSLSKQNHGKPTYFIVQEFVEGKLLHDYKEGSISETTDQQLVLLVYLILLMNYQLGLIPDTRPRYPMAQAYNWLTKTDNIMVTKRGVMFIDTRWLWEYKANYIKRGLFIPDLIINLAKDYINYLLENA